MVRFPSGSDLCCCRPLSAKALLIQGVIEYLHTHAAPRLPLPGLLPEPQSRLQVKEGQVMTLALLGGGGLQDRRPPCPATTLEETSAV